MKMFSVVVCSFAVIQRWTKAQL